MCGTNKSINAQPLNSQTGKIGTGKNTKSIFPTELEVHEDMLCT